MEENQVHPDFLKLSRLQAEAHRRKVDLERAGTRLNWLAIGLALVVGFGAGAVIHHLTTDRYTNIVVCDEGATRT